MRVLGKKVVGRVDLQLDQPTTVDELIDFLSDLGDGSLQVTFDEDDRDILVFTDHS